MREQKTELYFFLVIFIAALALTFFLFLPFLGTLAIAAVFAVIFTPLSDWVKRSCHCRETLAAIITLLIAVLGVLVPLSVFGYLLFQEARDLFLSLSSGDNGFLHMVDTLGSVVGNYIPGYEESIRALVESGLGTLTESLGSIFARTASVLFSIVLGLIAFYYFLRDGDKFREHLITYSPLEDAYDREILEKLRLTINSVIKGSLFVALLQGLLSGLGFALFGVPNPILLGSAAALGSLIPTIGTGLVFIPVVAYLLLTGSALPALGVGLWGLLAVGLIDNFVGPVFVGRGAHIHPFLILLSVLGGLSLFGPIGFILGPIALSLLVALGQIYRLLVMQGPKDKAS